MSNNPFRFPSDKEIARDEENKGKTDSHHVWLKGEWYTVYTRESFDYWSRRTSQMSDGNYCLGEEENILILNDDLTITKIS